MPTGTSMAYVGGSHGQYPLPKATGGYRPHQQRPAKAAGLDWSALRPACSSCGTRSSEINRNGLCPGCDTPTPTPAPQPAPVAAPARAKRTPIATGHVGRPHGYNSGTNVAAIRRLYLDDQLSIPQVAEATGHAKGTVRRVLLDSGITLRDDRRTRCGGKPTHIDDETAAQVRDLYINQRLTIMQTAKKIGRSHKFVARVMRAHGIEPRPDASAGAGHRVDGAGTLKAHLADLGATSRQVKDWALTQGLITEIHRGLPPARLVEAYADAHQDVAS